MKANALENIYLYPYSTDGIYEVETKPLEGTIEYTRTDAFVNKACEWLENNLQGVVGGSIYIEDFRKYMEE